MGRRRRAILAILGLLQMVVFGWFGLGVSSYLSKPLYTGSTVRAIEAMGTVDPDIALPVDVRQQHTNELTSQFISSTRSGYSHALNACRIGFAGGFFVLIAAVLPRSGSQQEFFE